MADEEAEDKRRAELNAWWRQEPLAWETRQQCAAQTHFEFSSRGDRVEGWLRSEGGGAARPLVVVVPGGDAGAADPLIGTWAERWSARGVAICCFDLPLHGARRSAKLSAALVDAASDLDRLAEDRDRRRLVAEFLSQCRWDLRGALAGVCAISSVDAGRVSCVGVALGALACAHAAEDPRVNAVVLVDPAPGGPERVDTSVALRRFGRPTLLLAGPESKTMAAEAERVALPKNLEAVADVAWPFLERVFAR